MKKSVAAFLGLFFLVFAQKMSAQSRFGASIMAGFTASQIDGDAAAGYHRPGWQAGLQAHVLPGGGDSKKEWTLGLRFQQRGSQSGITRSAALIPWFCRLQYVDVPVQFHLKDWAAEGEKRPYHKVAANAGLVYGRLINWKTDEPSIEERLNLANRNDLALVLGASFFATEHLGFRINWQRSLNYIFNPDKHLDSAGNPVINANPLQSKLVDFGILWRI